MNKQLLKHYSNWSMVLQIGNVQIQCLRYDFQVKVTWGVHV